MQIAEIQLSHPDLALSRTIAELPELRIELDYQVIADPDTYYLFFEVSGGDFRAFDEAVATDPTVAESTVIAECATTRVYRMRLENTERLVLPKAAELGIRVLHAVGAEGGWQATLQVPDPSALQAFRSYCASRGVEFTVKRLFNPEHPDETGEFGLTPTQRETLLTAYRAGYFQEPRGASLQAVADRLDVSSSAASGRLRRATAALVEHTIAGR